jgi:hypothetical protein
MASSRTEWPRSAANAVSASTRAKLPSLTTRAAKEATASSREPAGKACPRWYLPVSMPDASGKNGVVAPAGQGLADELLRLALPVHLRGVQVGDPGVEPHP